MTTAAENDLVLLRRYAQSRDASAFAEIADRHQDFAYSVCLRVLGNRADAEDVTQECFLRLARKAQQVNTSLAGWLHHCATDLSLNFIKSGASRRKREAESSELAKSRVDARWREILPFVDEALQRLPEDERTLLVEHFFKKRTQTELAGEFNVSPATVSRRIEAGIENLRRRFAELGVSVPSAAFVPLAQQFGTVAAPATLKTSLAKMALVGAGKTAGAGKPILGGALVKTVLVAALAAASVAAVVKLRGAPTPETKAEAAPVAASKTPAQPAPIMVTPRGSNAWDVFEDLDRKGLRVVGLGGDFDITGLIVPVELRYKPVEGKKFIEAVAAARELKIAWSRGGQSAILYSGVSDAEFAQSQKDLQSPDLSVRREAVWRSGWLSDPRVVAPLVKVAKDSDAATARLAIVALRHLCWESVVVLDDSAFEPLTAQVDSKDALLRNRALAAITRIGGEKALPFAERALADPDAMVRYSAALCFGYIGGEKATDRIEEALASQDEQVRMGACAALGHLGSERALGLLEKALASSDAGLQESATQSFFFLRGEQTLPLLKKALAMSNPDVRAGALAALGHVGGEKALALVAKEAASASPEMRALAAVPLGQIGGEKALELLEKLCADPDPKVRAEAARALALVGGETAVALCGKALADKHATVTEQAALSLGEIGTDKALELLEQAIGEANAGAVEALGHVGNARALKAIQKILSGPDPKLRRAAAGALRQLHGPEAAALAETIIDDPDASVRRELLTGYSGDNWPKVFEKALGDPDASLRALAATALGRRGGACASRLLLAAARTEHDTNVRHVFLNILKTQFADSPRVKEALQRESPPPASTPAAPPRPLPESDF